MIAALLLANQKKEVRMTGTTKYVGIDIGKRNCAVCGMDRDGNVLEHMKYRNTREAAGKLAKTVLSKYGKYSPAKTAYETYQKIYRDAKSVLYRPPMSGSNTTKF